MIHRSPARKAHRNRVHAHLSHRASDGSEDSREDHDRFANSRVKNHSEDEEKQLREAIDAYMKVEGDVRRDVAGYVANEMRNPGA